MDYLFNFEEALQRLNRDESEVNLVRNGVNESDRIPKTVTDKQLLCFLNACDGVEDTLKVLKMYYEIRKNYAVFKNRDPSSEAIQQCLKNQCYLCLPVTPDGYSVVYFSLSNTQTGNYSFDDIVKTFAMNIDLCLSLQGPRKGLIILFDIDNMRLAHLTKSKLSTIKLFFKYLQEALPVKLEAIHIFNSRSIINLLLALVKPFMKAEILKKLHLHKRTMNFRPFHEHHVPKSCLPSDYDGDLESVRKLHIQTCRDFERLREFFIHEEKQGDLINAMNESSL